MQIESTRRWSTCGRVCDNGRFDLMGVGRWQSGGARFLDAKLIEVADTDGGVTLLAQFGKSTPLIDALIRWWWCVDEVRVHMVEPESVTAACGSVLDRRRHWSASQALPLFDLSRKGPQGSR